MFCDFFIKYFYIFISYQWYPNQVGEKSELKTSKSEVERSQKQKEFISEPNTESQKERESSLVTKIILFIFLQ